MNSSSVPSSPSPSSISPITSIRREDELLTLYVRAGCDNRKYGACPFCQRIFMLLMLKVDQGANLKFRVATVPSSRLPEEFRSHGLRNLPAIISGRRVAIDTVEEIADYIESQYPTLDQISTVKAIIPGYTSTEEVDKLARNFFSKFCFYIKSVSRDSGGLVSELRRLNDYLAYLDTKFLFGDELTRLDCEVLPKLHHLRVVSSYLKKFEIPNELYGVWRYLNNAYNNAIFLKACPSDQEIVLHWASRPDTPCLAYNDYLMLTRNALERYSFDVPALATPVTL